MAGDVATTGSDPKIQALLERLRREPGLRNWVLEAPTGALASLGIAMDDHEISALLDRVEAMDSKPLPVMARDIMTPNPITIRPDVGVHQAAETLHDNRISGLMVCGAGGELVGVISEFDLISRSGRSVSDVMSTDVISVRDTATIDEVRTAIVSRRLRRVPVLDARGKLVGIISRSDLVRELAYRWVCTRCDNLVRARRPPEDCPRCGAENSYEPAPPQAAIAACPTCGRPLEKPDA